MNCQNETSFLEVLKCEGTRWPLPHVLLPFIAMLYTGNMWFVVALVYFWESFEEAMWMELQSYRLLFPGTPNTRESRLNSILLDPLCGFFGIALGIWLMYFLKSPFFQSRLASNQYVKIDPYTRELRLYSLDCGGIKKYLTKYSIYTCNGRWFVRYLLLFCAVSCTFAFLDEKSAYFNGNYFALIMGPAIIMSHAWMFSRDRYERYVIFGGKSDSHYYLVHGMIALVFAWIIGTLLVLKVVVNVTGTAPVIFAMSLVFVFLAEMIKMLFEGEKQQRMPVVNLLKS